MNAPQSILKSTPSDPKKSVPEQSRGLAYRHRVLGLLFLLAMVTYLDRVCISVSGSSIQKELGIAAEHWGWVLGAFALSYGIFEIPSGVLGDRLGPRRVLTRIVVWWSAFTALTGLVGGFWSLMATRFCFGAGEAGAFPNAAATIQRWFPARERAGAQGVVWMASRLGAAISPAVVVWLHAVVGWRTTFVLFGGLGVVWALVWHGWFRDRPEEKSGISREEITLIGSHETSVPHADTGSASLLKQSHLWWVMLMYFLYSWTGFFFLSWLPTFLENARGFSKTDLVTWSWLPFLFGGIANFIGGLTSDRLARRIGIRWGRRWIGLLGLLCTALFTGATLFAQDKGWTILFLALGYAGSDFMMPVAWGVCLDIGGRNAGFVTGAMNMAGQAAGFLSSVSFGYIVKMTGNNWNAPLVPMAVAAFLSALCWMRIDASRPLNAPEQ
jgi:ACS family glucarate transporter-like MFS transporter